MPNPFLILCSVLFGLLLITGGFFFALVLRRLDKINSKIAEMETRQIDMRTRIVTIHNLLTPEPGLKTVVTIAETPKGVKSTSAVSRIPRDLGEEMRIAIDKEYNLMTADGRREIRRVE